MHRRSHPPLGKSKLVHKRQPRPWPSCARDAFSVFDFMEPSVYTRELRAGQHRARNRRGHARPDAPTEGAAKANVADSGPAGVELVALLLGLQGAPPQPRQSRKLDTRTAQHRRDRRGAVRLFLGSARCAPDDVHNHCMDHSSYVQRTAAAATALVSWVLLASSAGASTRSSDGTSAPAPRRASAHSCAAPWQRGWRADLRPHSAVRARRGST